MQSHKVIRGAHSNPGTAELQLGIAMANPGTAELQLGILPRRLTVSADTAYRRPYPNTAPQHLRILELGTPARMSTMK